MPTFPPFVTIKFVAVVEPMTKEGPEIPFGLTESCPHGVVVPTPSVEVAYIFVANRFVAIVVEPFRASTTNPFAELKVFAPE